MFLFRAFLFRASTFLGSRPLRNRHLLVLVTGYRARCFRERAYTRVVRIYFLSERYGAQATRGLVGGSTVLLIFKDTRASMLAKWHTRECVF